jgi:hypothetical protein
MGAILQSISNRFMIAVGRGEVIQLIGKLSTYSDNKGCQKHAGTKGWECLFKPTTNCTIPRSQLRNRQSTQQFKAKWSEVEAENTFIPEQFRAQGLYWWWGVVQSYLFRPSDVMQRHIALAEVQLGWDREGVRRIGSGQGGSGHGGRKGTLFRIGLHIRHGDKTEECKWNPNWSCPTVITTEQFVQQAQAIASAGLRMLHAASGTSGDKDGSTEAAKGGSTEANCGCNANTIDVFIATDDPAVHSSDALEQLRRLCCVRVMMTSNNLTQSLSPFRRDTSEPGGHLYA